jgi:hypothetical protein
MKRILLIVMILTFVADSYLWAQGVDLQKLTQETQKLERGENVVRLVWWIPTEFWKESFKKVTSLTEDQKTAFYKTVDDYIVLSVIDAKTTVFGSVIPTLRDEIVSKLSLAIDQGTTLRPLPDSEVSSDARNLFAMMKPVLANILGQFGQSMEFICFKGIDSQGKKLLDPLGSGSLSVTLGNTIFRWRLPLGSLLPPNYDLQTGEEFPGNYIYNPFTGRKLVSTPPKTTTDSDNK